MEHTPLTVETQESNLFTEQELFNYELASKGQRFLNYIVDALFVNYVIDFITERALTGLFGTLAVTDEEGLVYSDYWSTYLAMTIFATLFNSFLYYSISEKAFRGKTLGKLLTGTRVIRDDGQELTWKDTMLRSISRWVPFEALSIFFRNDNRMWHDAWIKTSVVKSR